MLGGGRQEIINAVSNAFADGVTLRLYRSAPNAGSRGNWAGGDATSRGVELAMMAVKGEMGYPTVLTTKRLGFYDALCQGQPFTFAQPFGACMLEHVVFKFVAASMLAQTAVECAFKLHPRMKERLDDIESVTITSQDACIKAMNKTGPLKNPAERGHCVQYMVSVGLIYGRLSAADFEDSFAAGEPRIDALRDKMSIVEDAGFTRDLHTLSRRSVPNAVKVRFKDGSETRRVAIEYPAGHPRRRADGLAMVEAKFRSSIARRFPSKQQRAILDLFLNQRTLEQTHINELVDVFVI
jgi:2-methylcitrate dehydratase